MRILCTLFTAGAAVLIASSSGVGAEKTTGSPARIDMTVPANAKVWIDGRATKQTGTTRLFETPSLKTGETYKYAIRVRWSADGKAMDETKKVEFKAGDYRHIAVGTGAESALTVTDLPARPVAAGTAVPAAPSSPASTSPADTSARGSPATPAGTTGVRENPWRPSEGDPFNGNSGENKK